MNKNDLLANSKCSQCKFISKSSNGLKTHIRKQHRISQVDGNTDNSDVEETNKQEMVFKCEDCEYKTTDEKDLMRHAAKVHHQCEMYGTTLMSKSSLKVHRKEKHCNVCGKVGNNFWQKNLHGDKYDVCRNECYREC